MSDCGEIATVTFNVKLEKVMCMLGMKNGGQGRERWKWWIYSPLVSVRFREASSRALFYGGQARVERNTCVGVGVPGECVSMKSKGFFCFERRMEEK